MKKGAAERLREKGVVPTVQRVAIWEYLQSRSDHPTAEEIYEVLSVDFPSLSRATVYNTLELLWKLGEIQQLIIADRRAHYDPNPNPHHHFYCWRCGRLLDVEVTCPFAERGQVEGNRVEAVQACFYGTCSDCLKEEEAELQEKSPR